MKCGCKTPECEAELVVDGRGHILMTNSDGLLTGELIPDSEDIDGLQRFIDQLSAVKLRMIHEDISENVDMAEINDIFR